MRISAEHFRAGPYEAGPLALALTSRSGLLSIDIAELAIFGGKISGRLDYDFRASNDADGQRKWNPAQFGSARRRIGMAGRG